MVLPRLRPTRLMGSSSVETGPTAGSALVSRGMTDLGVPPRRPALAREHVSVNCMRPGRRCVIAGEEVIGQGGCPGEVVRSAAAPDIPVGSTNQHSPHLRRQPTVVPARSPFTEVASTSSSDSRTDGIARPVVLPDWVSPKTRTECLASVVSRGRPTWPRTSRSGQRHTPCLCCSS
jgi:hypothetical protein